MQSSWTRWAVLASSTQPHTGMARVTCRVLLRNESLFVLKGNPKLQAAKGLQLQLYVAFVHHLLENWKNEGHQISGTCEDVSDGAQPGSGRNVNAQCNNFSLCELEVGNTCT